MNHSSIIAVEGLPVIGIFAALAGILWAFNFHKASFVMMLMTVFALSFFRNPERHPTTEANTLVAPADGKVIFIGEVDEQRYLNRRAIKISIFMNVFNVHVNRAPETGKVSAIHYNKGKFVSANLDKASMDNEQNAVIMDMPRGQVMFVQIAGLIARRIVCWVKPGDALARGERFGLIMFGSRVDIYLPVGSQVRLKLGDKTTAGETIVGNLP